MVELLAFVVLLLMAGVFFTLSRILAFLELKFPGWSREVQEHMRSDR